jgi:putative ABC transport system substrate-binding protein
VKLVPALVVGLGIPVASLSRPGGNVTGASLITGALGAKRLELLRELVPSVRTIAMLINPDTPDSDPESKDGRTAAGALGPDIHVIVARSQRELEPAFGGPTAAVAQRIGPSNRHYQDQR